MLSCLLQPIGAAPGFWVEYKNSPCGGMQNGKEIAHSWLAWTRLIWYSKLEYCQNYSIEMCNVLLDP